MYRTHKCNQVNKDLVDQVVSVIGWIHRRRDLGGVIFFDLRDSHGLVQVVYNPDKEKAFSLAESCRNEFIIACKGIVHLSPEGTVNEALVTGEVEIIAEELEILNPSLPLPFQLDEYSSVGEEARLKYRFLDLRRTDMQHNLRLRSVVSSSLRDYLNSNGFLEIETPILTKATPEGARDYLVPSRTFPGSFFALPQSPQLFKQTLIASGFEKYYQFAKCFRDEDLRADRQPEFTQLDIELAFVESEDVISLITNMMVKVFKETLSVDLGEFPTISYADAMEKYGSDKPDTRFEMKIFDCSESSKGKGFKILDDSEYVCGITVNTSEPFTRKQIDQYTDWVKQPQIGAKGLIWIKHNTDGTFKSSIDKFYNHDDLLSIVRDFSKDSTTFLISGSKMKSLNQLGQLRLKIADDLGMIDEKKFCPLWVNDFPLFELDEDENKYHSIHHPFTSPKDKNINTIEKEPSKFVADAYDLVINGNEIGGGSIRIHNRDLQNQIFSILGFTPKEAKDQFGFLMNAFEYGAPPHGGIALGLDRLVAVMNGDNSIRDYIAFPKNNSGRDVMIDSPSPIDNDQLDELNIKLK